VSEDLFRFVSYRCVVGSTAYGLAEEGSDVDRRGFFVPPAELDWSLAGAPEQIERAPDEVYWEIAKFLRLALKANPNVLECLYSPTVEHCDPIASELLAMRAAFLSKHVHRTYQEYVASQFRKLENHLRSHGAIRWKHAMHLIRLLLAGTTLLREGHLPLDAGEHRERLLAIRRGETRWEDVERWRVELHGRLDEALASTCLPDEPDTARVDAFLIRARRWAAGLRLRD